MKFKIFIVIALLLSVVTVSSTIESNKALLGEWCNPNTYKSTGELKGFHLLEGGKCKSINVPVLKLVSWEVNGKILTTKGTYTHEGVEEEYLAEEEILKLTKDSLVLGPKERGKGPTFAYVRPDFAKKNLKIEKE